MARRRLRTAIGHPAVANRSCWLGLLLLGASALAAVVSLVGICGWRRRRGKADPSLLRPPTATPAPEDAALRGLTAAKARERRPEVDFARLQKLADRRALRRAIRTNLLTIFNLDMISIATLMFLLGSPASGLGTSAVLVANVVLRVGQELQVKHRLDRLIDTIRPTATVVRDGRPQQVPVRDVVVGDLIAVGLGDEVPVSGEIVSESGLTLAEPAGAANRADPGLGMGDRLEAGTYCTGGHALFHATEAGAWREAGRLSQAEVIAPASTPLTLLIQRMLYALLAVAAVLAILVLSDGLIPRGAPGSEAEYRNALSLVLGVAPTSLFFLLVISYVIGMQDVAVRGGLVDRQSTIEALSRISAVRLAARSVISGTRITVKPLPAMGQRHQEDLVRRLLGDFVHSVSANSTTIDLLADALSGSARQPVEAAGHLSVYGWQAATFDDPDMRGTYVVGVPQVLREAEVAAAPSETAGPEPGPGPDVAAARHVGRFERAIARFRGRRARPPHGEAAPAATAGPPSPGATAGAAGATVVAPEPASAQVVTGVRGLVSRVGAGLGRALSPREHDAALVIEERQVRPRQLRFEHRARIEPLFDSQRMPTLPGRLQALAEIVVADAVGRDAVAATTALERSGIRVRIADGADPAGERGVAASLGLDEARIRPAGGGTGLTADVVQQVNESADAGPDLVIAMRGASQAALATADMVLVDSSLRELPRILSAARRVTNGVMAMLKLNLSFIGTQLSLLVLALVVGYAGFPYSPVQSGIVTAFSISIPSIILLRLAPSRIDRGRSAARSLARFVIPGVLTTVVLVDGVFIGFLRSGVGMATAQEAVTWTLVAAGLIRVLLAVPPSRFLAQAEPRVGDARVYALVALSGGLFLAGVSIPFTSHLLDVGWLPSASAYGVVALALVPWTGVQLLFWAGLGELDRRRERRASRVAGAGRPVQG